MACESEAPLDEGALTQRIALYAEGVAHEAGQALAHTTAEEGTVAKVMGSASNTATTPSTPPMTAPITAAMTSAMTTSMTAPLSAAMPPTAMLRATVGSRMTRQLTNLELPSMMTTEEQFDETGKEIRRMMQERLFVASNFESKTADTAIYLLAPEPTCRPLSQDTDVPGTVPELDQACVNDLTKVAVRIAVKADGDGARLTVLIGPDRLPMVVAIIHSDELAGEVDLPQAMRASEYINQQVGDGSPTSTFDRLTGKLRASLKRVAAGKITASLSILEALDIAPTNDAEVKSAAADPLLALTSDRKTQTAEIRVALGASEIATSWDPQGTGLVNRDLRIATGGIYGQAALDENAKQIVLTDVGIGQTKVTVRGTTIFDLNLNADSMRRFSGKATVNAAGTTRIEITPKVDLSLVFDYNAVAADLSPPPEATIAHETYGVSLTNAGAGIVIDEVPSTTTFNGGLRMVAGTFTLSAASVPGETITVPAGKCLTSRDPVPVGAHPLLGSFVAIDCP